MYDAQAGVCKICGRPDDTKRGMLQIDHCHTTGKVRGLLCHHCNILLGNARDDVAILEKAIAYLAASRGG
ncbi:Recombination endonuclease VII [compost metagenome]